MRSTRPLIRGLVACAGIGLIAGATALAAGENQTQLSAQGSAEEPAEARASHTAYDPSSDRYLTVWEGETDVDGESEIFGRITGPDGAPMGAAMRLTNVGADGDTAFAASDPAVVYNGGSGQYLLVWTEMAPVTQGGASGPDFEVYAMRLTAAAEPIGDPVRMSEVGGDELNFSADNPAIAINPTDDTYLVAWDGTATVGEGLLPFDEVEVFAQRVNAAGEKIGANIRVSNMGPDGDADYGTRRPAIAHSTSANEFLLAWSGTDDSDALVSGEQEIYAQRLSATGTLLGERVRISQTGADGDPDADADAPAVAHDPVADRYFVAWEGALLARPNPPGDPNQRDFEIFGRMLNADASGLRLQDKLSETGAEGDASVNARHASVAYNAVGKEFLVAWHANGLPGGEGEVFGQRIGADGGLGEIAQISQLGTDGDVETAASQPSVAHDLADDEYLISWTGSRGTGFASGAEIWTNRIAGDSLPAPAPRPVNPDPDPDPDPDPGVKPIPVAPSPTPKTPSEARCAVAAEVVGKGASGKLSLTTGQLRINQRIGQAAVRRVTAIQNWLDEGITGEDICGGSITAEQLAKDTSLNTAGIRALPATASPRPLVILKAKEKTDVKFTLTAGQLRTNQRVYLAALRRANALAARLDGKLTGGDLKDGSLSSDRLSTEIALGTRVLGGTVSAASTTEVAPPGEQTGDFTPTIRQMQINQRIAQAAIRRSNELRLRLESGLTGDNFADGSITAVDWTR